MERRNPMVPLHEHRSSASFSAVLRDHVQVSEFFYTILALFSLSAKPTSPHGGKHLKILIFKPIWPFQSYNTMANRKRSHRLRSPTRHNDRSQSESPPKRRKTPSLSPSSEGESLDPILKTFQQMQTQTAKTKERISTMETPFKQHSRPFALSQATPDYQISVLAYSDGELLDYTEDDASRPGY